MKIFGGKRRLKSNSALAIAAGCAVAFMFIATVISIGIYQQRMDEVLTWLRQDPATRPHFMMLYLG